MRQALTFLATFENDHRRHENAGRHLDPGAAYHLGRSLHRSGADIRSARGAAEELTQGRGGGVGTRGRTMLSVDQVLRFVSVPTLILAFHVATQFSGG